MSKKEYSKGNVIGFLCFCALGLSTICFILAGIPALAAITSVCNLVASIALIVAVVWSGWGFAKTLSRTWQIVYIVFAVIAVIATLFASGIF